MYNDCVGMTDYIPDVPAMFVVVVLRLEHSHSFIASLDNHSTAPGPAWCRHSRECSEWALFNNVPCDLVALSAGSSR